VRQAEQREEGGAARQALGAVEQQVVQAQVAQLAQERRQRMALGARRGVQQGRQGRQTHALAAMARQPQRQAVVAVAQAAEQSGVQHRAVHAFDVLHLVLRAELQAHHDLVRQQRLQLALRPQEELARLPHRQRRLDRVQQVLLLQLAQYDQLFHGQTRAAMPPCPLALKR
jgi:hypothetical protein